MEIRQSTQTRAKQITIRGTLWTTWLELLPRDYCEESLLFLGPLLGPVCSFPGLILDVLDGFVSVLKDVLVQSCRGQQHNSVQAAVES